MQAGKAAQLQSYHREQSALSLGMLQLYHLNFGHQYSKMHGPENTLFYLQVLPTTESLMIPVINSQL